ncbi:hypothetical protein [Streptomyces flavofungini]|uniref:hypothetical protein n=1 Tax=Streptomyces flavofungini TaxID=68200 RepID=UPI0034DE7B0D
MTAGHVLGCRIHDELGPGRRSRTGFYPKKNPNGTVREGPSQHLGDEFAHRLNHLPDAGTLPGPRDAQTARLKAGNDALRERAARQSEETERLTECKKLLALSRIAAQHEEIARLRGPQAATGTPAAARLAAVPREGRTIGSCS